MIIKVWQLQNVRFYRTVSTNRMPVSDDEKPPRCRMSGSLELYAQIKQGSKTQPCQMPESIELCAQIDAARGQDPLQDASVGRPRMQEFNGLFCQIALGEHKR